MSLKQHPNCPSLFWIPGPGQPPIGPAGEWLQILDALERGKGKRFRELACNPKGEILNPRDCHRRITPPESLEGWREILTPHETLQDRIQDRPGVLLIPDDTAWETILAATAKIVIARAEYLACTRHYRYEGWSEHFRPWPTSQHPPQYRLDDRGRIEPEEPN